MNFTAYVIENTLDGKRYVGQTLRGVNKRWKEHKAAAKKGAPGYFYSAIRKHGTANFRIALVDDTAQSQIALNSLEINLIARFTTTNPLYGYNMTLGGEGGVPTEEVREKLSRAKQGTKLTLATREKMRAAHLGMAQSQQAREKLRIAKLAYWRGLE